jgi:dihydropteroate synthase
MVFRRLTLDWRRTYLMGVVNATPDSFSDGQIPDSQRLKLGSELADLVDVGGESTRPGAQPVSAAEEWRRIATLIPALAAERTVSVDTSKAEVADRALAAGAEIVNDVTGGRGEPDLLRVAARRHAALVLGHWRKSGEHADVVAEVCQDLSDQIALAVEAGVPRARVMIDPGLGFGKTAEHNLALLAGLGRLQRLGCAIVIGASRKSFLGKITGEPVDRRELATAAADTAAVLNGANVVRVHDVAAQRDAIEVADAIRYCRVPT